MITIIDTSCANLSSVQYALERAGLESIITKCPTLIRDASHLILPGVGSALEAMQNLSENIIP